MNIKGIETIFEAKLLDQLPPTYRYLVRIESSTFKEHFTGYRFSKSQRHFSKNFINANAYKPLSEIIYQDFKSDGK
jgi:hypothetical protein